MQTAFCGYYDKNYKIKTSFFGPEGPKAGAIKNGINSMIFKNEVFLHLG